MTNLFSEADQPVTFDSLVGEGKRYSDPDTAAAALLEKDRFIEQLKNEGAELRQELRSRTNLEEIVGKLKPATPAPTPLPSGETAPLAREPVVEPAVDLEEKFREFLAAERSKDTATTNVNKAKAGLIERFGSDYASTLKTIAAELEVSEAFLNDMATTSPTGLLKLVDSVKKPAQPPVNPPRSRDAGPVPNAAGRRNKAYYDDLRRNDINLYLSARIQNQLYQDAMQQGESFYK